MKNLIICLLFICSSSFVFCQISINDGLTHERIVSPGTEYTGTITVSNAGNSEREAKVYIRDYLFNADGKKDYADPGTNPRSSTAWIEFTPNRLFLVPRETAEITYTLTIPSDESLIGTYWCMLMVEEIPENSEEATVGSEDTMTLAIKQVFRYGIQLVQQIGETGSPSLSFSNTKILKVDESKNLQFDITNTGTRWIVPQIIAEIYSDTGDYLQDLEGEQFRIFPGTSVRATISLDELSPGLYKALVLADGGGIDIFGANYTLKIQ